MLKEIKKTLAILKDRWPEALLVIATAVLTWVLPAIIMAKPLESVEPGSILWMIFFVVVAVLAMLLRAGFLRTIYTETTTQHMPGQLISAGKHFFWRLLGFNILIGAAVYLIGLLLLSLSMPLLTEQAKIQTAPVWLIQLCIQAAMLLLIKVAILVEPVIIVKDCPLLDSLRIFRYYRLLDARVLIVFYVVQLGLAYGGQVVAGDDMTTTAQYSWLIAIMVLAAFVEMFVAVTAVRYVASVDFGYDIVLHNPEDTLEQQDKNEDDSEQS